MKIGGLCQTHMHLYPLSLQGCKTCFIRSETIELLLSSNFSSAESYVDLLTNPASIEDVWHLLFLEMRWGLLYNEKGSSLSYWSYLGIIDIRTMAFPRASRVLLELEKLPQCHRQLQWRYSHVCRTSSPDALPQIIPNYTQAKREYFLKCGQRLQ